MCFNCATGSHRAAGVLEQGYMSELWKTTSHLDLRKDTNQSQSPTNQSSESVLPVIIIKVNGVKCRALIDTGSGSSYISAKLVDILKAKPVATPFTQVEMLMSSKSVNVDIYEMDTESLDGKHQMKVKLLKVNKPELLPVENPQYADFLRGNAHLSGVEIAHKDAKSELPVHVIFGSGDNKMKTK